MLETISYGTYFFFAAFALIAFAFTWFVIPETKGRTLEEMDAVFGDETAREEKARLFCIAQGLGLEEVGDAAWEEKTGKSVLVEKEEL